jgi:hypothetical protein
MPRIRPRRLTAHPWEAALVVLATVALGWQLLVALVLPPFASDALTYHLTTVATWLREGDLAPTPLSLCCARYPGNSELLFAWPALLKGDDRLVDAVQVGFAILGALAVAGLARSAGLERATAAAAGALFAVTPIVLAQAPTNYADVIVAACALAGLHALVRFAATGAWQRLAVAGLAAGLVLGIKGTGIVWAVALGLTTVAVAVARRRGAGALAAFALPCLALGSAWYLRNWIDTGNPFYPFRVRPAGLELFRGPVEVGDVLTAPAAAAGSPAPVAVVRSWLQDVAFWRVGSYNYEQRLGGLGPLWPWLGLPLLAPAALWLRRRRSPALVALLVIGLVLVVQPYRWWSRFTIPLAAAGAIAIACAAVWAPRRWMRGGVRGAALGLAVAAVLLSSLEVDPASRAPSLRADRLLDLAGSPARDRSVGHLFFREYRFLDDVPADATVMVDLGARRVRFVYPLFGSALSRRVVRAGAGPPPAGAWAVTAAGRPLDRRLSRDARFTLASDVRGVRAWMPVSRAARTP